MCSDIHVEGGQYLIEVEEETFVRSFSLTFDFLRQYIYHT